MKKFLLFLVLVIVVAVAVTGVIGYTQMDRIVKSGVETFGPKIIQAPVTLDDVHISPWSGVGELSGLTIGNPEGFKTEHAIKLKSLHVEVDVASLKTDVIRIREIRIDGPVVMVEGLKGRNLKKIQENAESFSKKPKAEKAIDAGGKPAKKVIIDSIHFKDGRIHYSPVLGQSIPLRLPDLHLTAIGEASGGATAGDVIKQLLLKIDDAVFGVVAGAGKLVGDAALGGARIAGQAAGEGVQLVGNVAEGGAKAVDKVAGEGTQLVGGVASGGAKVAGKAADVGTDAVKDVAGAATGAGKAVGEGAGKLVKGLGGILGGGDTRDESQPENP